MAESDEDSSGTGRNQTPRPRLPSPQYEERAPGPRGRFIISGLYNDFEFDDSDIPRSFPLRDLESFINDWSSDPSFDRCQADRLILSDLFLTRPFITRLLPLLLHHEGSNSLFHANDHMKHSSATCTTATIGDLPALKFHSVEISNCSFFSSAAPVTLDEHDDVCTPDDKNSFLAALAQLPGFLKIGDELDETYEHTKTYAPICSSEILPALLNVAEIESFKVTRLDITVPEVALLSDLQYIKLGAMIQGSEQLTDLALTLPLPLHDVPQDFFDHLVNSVHLHALSLCYLLYAERNGYPSVMFGEDGNGVVERILRNPQCQLIKLDLSHLDIDDRQLMALAQLLPDSHIGTLVLFDNLFGVQGLLEFARQFPNMLSLNSIYICHDPNPLEDAPKEVIEECGDFFLQGLIGNPSITRFSTYDDFSQRPLMLHYLSLNRAGRKLLSSSQKHSIPDGLWPLVLERAGASRVGSSPQLLDNGPVNAIFFFLQNCPKLVSYCM